MKWYKHDSDASQDAKIRKLVIRHGAEGYAVYFHCLELIAGDVTESNITFELEHDSEIISDNLKIKSEQGISAIDKVNNIMKYIIGLGLFEESNGKIFCFKMASRIDKSMIKNELIKNITNKYQPFSVKTLDNPCEINENSRILLLEEKRREEKRREEKEKKEEENKENDSLLLSSEVQDDTIDLCPEPEPEEEKEIKMQKPDRAVPIANEMYFIICKKYNNDFQHPEVIYWRDHSNLEAEKMFDHYQANGWKQSNGNMIKDYRACIRNWMRRHDEFKGVKK